jgi:uncharacterized protein YuzE
VAMSVITEYVKHLPELERLPTGKHGNLFYDREGDVLYVSLRAGAIAEDTVEVERNVLARYDAQGQLVGYTILNASLVAKAVLPVAKHIIRDSERTISTAAVIDYVRPSKKALPLHPTSRSSPQVDTKKHKTRTTTLETEPATRAATIPAARPQAKPIGKVALAPVAKADSKKTGGAVKKKK